VGAGGTALAPGHQPLTPSEPIYYKALGKANARLGRYAEAVRAFKSGAEVAPSDREFNRLIEMVRAHARSS
jgi:Flp pilus assembly protein TadD